MVPPAGCIVCTITIGLRNHPLHKLDIHMLFPPYGFLNVYIRAFGSALVLNTFEDTRLKVQEKPQAVCYAGGTI